MVAVLAAEARVAALVARSAEVSIAAVNGPASVVVSGRRVSGVADRLALGEGVMTQALAVSHAFHSPLMRPMVAAFARRRRGLRLRRRGWRWVRMSPGRRWRGRRRRTIGLSMFGARAVCRGCATA